MAETNAAGGAAEAAPVITQGQTTAVGEDTQAVQEQPAGDPAAQEQPRASSIWDSWMLYAVAGLWIWYLFGNKKRRAAKAAEKKETERRNTLQKGDMIVTIGRMHGAVVAYTDATVTIRPDPKADYTMTFDRQAIFKVMPRPGEDVPEEPVKK